MSLSKRAKKTREAILHMVPLALGVVALFTFGVKNGFGISFLHAFLMLLGVVVSVVAIILAVGAFGVGLDLFKKYYLEECGHDWEHSPNDRKKRCLDCHTVRIKRLNDGSWEKIPWKEIYTDDNWFEEAQ